MDGETAEEIKSHFDVVAESLRSEIRTVGKELEGFQDKVEVKFAGVFEEFNDLKSVIRCFIQEPDRRNRVLDDLSS